MFLRCLAFSRKDGSQRKYLQIVQTYRESGRVRQKIIANLGRLDELIASGTLEKLSDALSRYVEKKELLCKAEELMATSALSFGPVPIFTALWKKLGLPEAITSATKRETATYEPAPVIFRMVLGRLLDPSSKLSTHRWAETIWWEDGAVVELQHYYRSLGILARSIKKIEEHLYYRERDLFTPAPDLLFFDTTSTYFTGAGPMTDLACHGFSKDNYPENKQVMVGVVMTREGTPLAHHVFPGNTPDAAAFSEVIRELSTRFGIKRVIVVGDRGMFNAKVIERIEELKLEYIAGVNLPSGHVPSHRSQGGEAERTVGPYHAARTLRGPYGSSESRGGGIPDPDRAVSSRQRHLPGRRGTRSASRQPRSLTENNSWKCSVTHKNRQNRG